MPVIPPHSHLPAVLRLFFSLNVAQVTAAMPSNSATTAAKICPNPLKNLPRRKETYKNNVLNFRVFMLLIKMNI